MSDKQKSVLVSFKLPPELAAKLEDLRGEGESIHLVAKRIVEAEIDRAPAKTPFERQIEEKFGEVLARLDLLGKAPAQ
jgi:hypothetical protein